MLAILRFNFASPGGDPRLQGELLSAAMELAQFGDRHGIAAVSVDEHHATGHGWSTNPVMIAGMILARTANIFASIDCALAPLWNPIRLAEDIALVDAMSQGRLHTTVGLGYRQVEYQALGVDFTRRGELMDQALQAMLAAWTDTTAGVLSGTWSKPHPPLYLRGGVRATVRRAVRFGLPLSLPDHRPDLAEYYAELCRASGIQPYVLMPPAINRGMIYLHEDPDRAWDELGGHILWEALTYGQWSDDPSCSSMQLPGVRTLEQVRASGRYRFLTPDQLIAEVRESMNYGPIVMHPLVGGMPIDEAWKSVQLLTDEVLPALR
ncbi:LLM class flavin-dependent oxidoreductase [Mycolicibacterium sp. CH28]|uniref:LLM class flavin-dependent oxidoreductase n=1 Tax=Mycolicibacterium sp. CH28 TaxID=2512237 RepID=UPI0010808F83|nr:LLM class flavin-dependent oxidoreductase [Mycolicibacterium sp. CH28]TGD88320.1 LLM class flavin-dependent oxidoreductase [Mycolicibacterium sp. CH28]